MPTTGYENKYTIRDVREDPRLRELAFAYLRSYGGDFEPLVEAKGFLRVVGEDMPHHMVKVVLNCMRNDYTIADKMPRPARQVDPVLQVVKQLFGKPVEKSQPTRPIEPPKRSLRPYDLKAKWNCRYIVATAKNATAAHLLDEVKSRLVYFPYNDTIKVNLATVCSANPSTGVAVKEIPEGRHLCNPCRKLSEERRQQHEEALARRIAMRG